MSLGKYYREDNANVHRGIHELSRRATLAYEGARNRVAEWLGASESSEVIWTRGTTEAINLVAATWGMDQLERGRRDPPHHHGAPLQHRPLAVGGPTDRRPLRYIEMDDEGKLVLDELDTLLTERTRLVALTHVSNALGTINPVDRVIEAAQAKGPWCCWTAPRPFPT